MALGRDFRRFWLAAVLANVGDGIRLAAFPLLAAQQTGDPLVVGAVVAAGTLPWLLTGLAAGALVDRRGARPVLLLADVARTGVLAALVAALVLDRATPALVLGTAFLLGVGETLRDTAAQTVVPRLVPDALLERANSRLVAGEVAGNEFVGPLVGGLLFGVGAALPFVANSAALALAVLLLLSLPATVLGLQRPSGEAVAPAGVPAGLRWLARQPVLRLLVLTTAAVAVADSAWFAVLVLYAQDRLAVGATGFGVLLAIGAAGGLAGALVAERVLGGGRHRSALAWSMGVTATTPGLLLVVPQRAVAGFVVLATSAAFAVFNVAAVSLRQRLVPAELLGRVTAASRTLVLGGSAGGALLGGALAAGQGLEAPFVLCVVLGTGAALAWTVGSRPAAAGR